MSDDDLPMISLSSEGPESDLTPQKEVRVNAPEPRKNPASEIRPPAAPASGASDPRKASELRRPGSVAPAKPGSESTATRPAVQAPIAPRPAVERAPLGDDEDPEKLLREYADRQKTKVLRLEQQLGEYKKVVAERDGLRAKVDALGKELQDAKRQLEAAGKSDEIIKDLQGKVDAAILSNSILTDDKDKLKKALSQQTDYLKKSEERSTQAEKSLAEVQKQLAEETEGREEAEGRVAAALEALQSDASPAKAVSEMATRPIQTPAPAPVRAAEEKAAPAEAARPVPAKAPAGRPGAPPGRFSFLKK